MSIRSMEYLSGTCSTRPMAARILATGVIKAVQGFAVAVPKSASLSGARLMYKEQAEGIRHTLGMKDLYDR